MEKELLRNLKLTADNNPSSIRSNSILKSFVKDLCFWKIIECESFDGNNDYGRINCNKKNEHSFIKKQRSIPTMKEAIDIDMANEEEYFKDMGSDNSIENLSPSLPKSRWKSAIDPESGKIYYYDAITRKTQWKKVGILNTILNIKYNTMAKNE